MELIMKLELKHYQPYVLSKPSYMLSSGTIVKNGFDCEDLYDVFWSIRDYEVFNPVDDYKLILRPLSDYFKNGLNGFSDEDMAYMKLIIKGQTFHYGSISYNCIQWLCENHYDFQNLIRKGLAIDINTIQK